ncbi:MAG: leucine-rich repeat protein, partial [Oscillospiraceae bacterium]|nr:leucine-rich repeat protein [Oscillospiraceae bacterium]
DSVTTIADSTFKNCDELTEIILPDTITSLGTYIFSDCDKLENISIPSDFSELPDGLFSGCKSLKEMTLPENITEIPRNLFNCCYALTDVNIPESVTTISDHAFYKCTNLENISIPATVDSIEYWAFDSTKWLENKKAENPLVIVNNVLVDGTTYSGELEIPENVTKISGYAFEACAGLEKITIPEQVIEIGESAFYNCGKLTDVVIENPDCVIEDSANVFTNSWGYASPMGMIPGDFNGIIYCHENSTAHEYAVKFERAYSIIGSNIVYDPIVPEPITTYIDPAKTSTVTWTSYTTVSQVSADAPQESVTPETSLVSTTVTTNLITEPAETTTVTTLSTTTSSLSELTTTTTSTTTSINEPTTTTSEAIKKTYDINDETYRTYVDSLGEKIAYEEEFVAYLNEAYTDIEDIRYTHVYNAIGNENVKGVNSRLYIVESIVPGTNEKARQFEKINFYWGTSNEDEYSYGFLNYDEVFGGNYSINEINAHLEKENLKAHMVSVAAIGNSDKKVVHYDDISEENVVATFLELNEQFGAEIYGYSTEMENVDIFYDASFGDADGDNELTVRDCSFIALAIAQGRNDELSDSADYNSDGEVTVRDAAAIAKSLAQA